MGIRHTTFGEVVSTRFDERGEHVAWGFPTPQDEAAKLRLQTVREFYDKGRTWNTGKFPVHIEDVPTLDAAE